MVSMAAGEKSMVPQPLQSMERCRSLMRMFSAILSRQEMLTYCDSTPCTLVTGTLSSNSRCSVTPITMSAPMRLATSTG